MRVFELPYQYKIMRICGSELKKTEHIFRFKRAQQEASFPLVANT